MLNYLMNLFITLFMCILKWHHHVAVFFVELMQVSDVVAVTLVFGFDLVQLFVDLNDVFFVFVEFSVYLFLVLLNGFF